MITTKLWPTYRNYKLLASDGGRSRNGKIDDGRIDLTDGVDHLKARFKLAELLDLKAELQIGTSISSAKAFGPNTR